LLQAPPGGALEAGTAWDEIKYNKLDYTKMAPGNREMIKYTYEECLALAGKLSDAGWRGVFHTTYLELLLSKHKERLLGCFFMPVWCSLILESSTRKSRLIVYTWMRAFYGPFRELPLLIQSGPYDPLYKEATQIIIRWRLEIGK
jgi:hypothetical protein